MRFVWQHIIHGHRKVFVFFAFDVSSELPLIHKMALKEKKALNDFFFSLFNIGNKFPFKFLLLNKNYDKLFKFNEKS